MEVAIAGAQGFIGSALTRALEARGDTVIPLVRPRGNARSDGRAIRWDPYADTMEPRGLEGVDAVVNLAGVSIGGGIGRSRHMRRIRESRVRTTDLLARTIASSTVPPRVFLVQSATGYYGDHGEEPVVESSAAGRDPLARLVVDWEAAAQPAIRAGVRTVITRTALIQDPRGGMLRPLLPTFKIGLGARIGSGRQWLPWITLDDAISGMLYCLDGSLDGPVNLASPNPIRGAAFTKAVARAVGRPAWLVVPDWAVRAGAGNALGPALLASQRVLPERLSAAGFTFSHPELESALRAVLGR